MQDIRCTDDLLVENGDFMVGEASEDIIERLAYANVGEFKMAPQSGFGLVNMINAPGGTDALMVPIMEDLKRNGVDYKKIEIDSNGINITLNE